MRRCTSQTLRLFRGLSPAANASSPPPTLYYVHVRAGAASTTSRCFAARETENQDLAAAARGCKPQTAAGPEIAATERRDTTCVCTHTVGAPAIQQGGGQYVLGVGYVQMPSPDVAIPLKAAANRPRPHLTTHSRCGPLQGLSKPLQSFVHVAILACTDREGQGSVGFPRTCSTFYAYAS